VIQSQSVTNLRLVECSFQRPEFNPFFRALFRTKLNLCSLTVKHCEFDGGDFCSSLFQNLSRNDSSLKNLVVQDFTENLDCTGLLRAVGESNLDSFSIGAMSLDGHDVDNILPQLMDAVKKNFSLRSVELDDDWHSIGQILQPRLAFYANRNETLAEWTILQPCLALCANRNEQFAEWTENPCTVPAKLWPEAISMAQQASKESLFKSSKALSGKGIGLSQGKRKRKLTNFCKPS